MLELARWKKYQSTPEGRVCMIMEWIKKLTDIIMPLEPVVEEEDDAKESKKAETKAEEPKATQVPPIQQQSTQQTASQQSAPQPNIAQNFQAEKQTAVGGGATPIFGHFVRTGGNVNTSDGATSMGGVRIEAFNSEPEVRPSLAVVKTPQITMKIYTPTKYDEVIKSIGTDLIKHNAIVVNYEGAEESIQQRIGDFVLGVVYTVNGRVEMISNKIVLYVPEGFDIEPAQAAIPSMRRYN